MRESRISVALAAAALLVSGCAQIIGIEDLPPHCGDGIVQPSLGEACDDGGRPGGCSSDCKGTTLEDGPEDGGLDGPVATACGDGKVDDGEQCDDQNTVSGDGCSADCLSSEVCGDSYTDIDEECDMGGEVTADCDSDCTMPSCGDALPNALALARNVTPGRKLQTAM